MKGLGFIICFNLGTLLVLIYLPFKATEKSYRNAFSTLWKQSMLTSSNEEIMELIAVM